MTHHAIARQPDDPGIALCPCCRRPWPDEDGDLEKLIRRNIARVPLAEIARAANVPLSRVERVVSKLRREPEPRGA